MSEGDKTRGELTEIGFWACGSPDACVGGGVEGYAAGCVGEFHGDDEGLSVESVG